MPRATSRLSSRRLTMAAYLALGLALVALVALAVRDTWQSWTALRGELLRSEIDRLRLQAQRVAGRIERDLERQQSRDVSDFDPEEWLRQSWQRIQSAAPQQERPAEVAAAHGPASYAALVDNQGLVAFHSTPQRQGRRLTHRAWYDRIVYDVGNDVLLIRGEILGTGQPAYDVGVPVRPFGKEVATYHLGLNVATFEHLLAQRRHAFWQRRIWMLASALLIVGAAATSLYYLATHSSTLRKHMNTQTLQRTTEVSQLAAGLAHEIRNPLHAIQLNLHTLQRAYERGQPLSGDEIRSMVEQSSREIDRIEHLMQQLLGFATPDQPRDEVVNVKEELHAIVDFIEREMERHNVQVELLLADEPLYVRMDHGRLRQVVLNLLQNAQQAMPSGGQVTVIATGQRDTVEIVVADRGTGVAEADRQRIFEPFYSTKPNGTGLGLSLVRRFVDEVGGQIGCENNEHGGATFRILLPAAKHPEAKGRKS